MLFRSGVFQPRSRIKTEDEENAPGSSADRKKESGERRGSNLVLVEGQKTRRMLQPLLFEKVRTTRRFQPRSRRTEDEENAPASFVRESEKDEEFSNLVLLERQKTRRMLRRLLLRMAKSLKKCEEIKRDLHGLLVKVVALLEEW